MDVCVFTLVSDMDTIVFYADNITYYIRLIILYNLIYNRIK